MKEGCKEALRETLAVSLQLSATAYLSDCLYIQSRTKKNTKWLLASFTAHVEAGACKQNRRRDRERERSGSELLCGLEGQSVFLCAEIYASDCELLSMVLN